MQVDWFGTFPFSSIFMKIRVTMFVHPLRRLTGVVVLLVSFQ
jgi:hypothetical protein